MIVKRMKKIMFINSYLIGNTIEPKSLAKKRAIMIGAFYNFS